MDINAVIMRGTIVTTPQEGRTPSGAREVSARIKMIEHSDGREFATWYPVCAYGKSADALIVAHVGAVVAVTGKLATRKGKDGAPESLYVMARTLDVEPETPGPQHNGRHGASSEGSHAAPQAGEFQFNDTDAL